MRSPVLSFTPRRDPASTVYAAPTPSGTGVNIHVSTGGASTTTVLTPAEARSLANHLRLLARNLEEQK